MNTFSNLGAAKNSFFPYFSGLNQNKISTQNNKIKERLLSLWVDIFETLYDDQEK